MFQNAIRREESFSTVILAAFALFAFAYPDDASEEDSASSQSEMLKESSVKVPTHPNQQGVAVDSIG